MKVYKKLYKHYLFLLFFVFSTNLFATEEQSLIVFLKSGIKVCLPIIDKPKITFNGTTMRIGNGDYLIENVSKWMIGDEDKLITNIDNIQESVNIIYKNNIFKVGRNQVVHVYNEAGIKMPIELNNGELDTSGWARGIYVLKICNETFKIRKQ